MRTAFVQGLVEAAEGDSRVVLLTGDLGFAVLEPFAERFPTRFFNVGVAEQNMIGIATGLAEAGYIPYVYSIATFASMRPYEFIRNGPVHHELPVRIVGVGGGLGYGHNGVSHFAIEDIALMRVQPDLTVVIPSTSTEARTAIASTQDLRGPVYFRLAKQDASLPGLDDPFVLGRLAVLRDGAGVAIVALGSMAGVAVDAADELAAEGTNASVAVVTSFNPGPEGALAEFLAEHRLVVSVEDHYVSGGLGSFVCEVAAEAGTPCRVVRVAVKATPDATIGSEAYLRELHGISSGAVAAAIRREQVLAG